MNTKAWPASPLVYMIPPVGVPLLVPMLSLALPSARHQLTKPDGAGVQGGGRLTVSTALELRTEPNTLVTSTA